MGTVFYIIVNRLGFFLKHISSDVCALCSSIGISISGYFLLSCLCGFASKRRSFVDIVLVRVSYWQYLL